MNNHLINKKHSVIGIRTHKWGELEDIFYSQVKQYFSDDNIYIVCDEVENTVEIPPHLKKISFNKAVLKSDGLIYDKNFITQRGIGWMCGDYSYYYLSKFVDSKYYWIIEPDVHLLFDNINNFFSKCDHIDSDGILYLYGKADPGWGWYRTGLIIDNQPCTMLFCLSRLSQHAIKLCFEERKRITSYCLDNPDDRYKYPNDEALVSTVLTKNKLNITKLEDLFPDAYRHFTWNQKVIYPIAQETFFSNQIIHKIQLSSDLSNTLFDHIKNGLSQSTSINKLSDEYKVGFNNVDNICSLFTSKVNYFIYGRINLIATHLYFSEKQAELKANNIDTRSWIYNNELVVFDIDRNTINYVLEVGIQDNKFIARIFSRNQNNNVLNYIGEKYPQYKTIESKLTFFEEDVTQEYLQNKIKEATNFLIKISEEHSVYND